MNPQDTVIALTQHIRDTVRPHLGAWHGRQISGTANSGDATFAIDDIAEDAIVSFIKREGLSIAYYSEDKGLMTFGSHPDGVVIIDPIDGTRPAVAGFESCVVSVAWAEYTPAVTLGDVRYGCISELKNDNVFFAERNKGATWTDTTGHNRPLRLLPIETITDAPLSFEAVARPFEYLAVALSEIVNTASTRGGCFLFNSTAYSLTRLLTGQLAACLDIGARILQEYPQTRARYAELGRGKPLGLFTYDIAAAALIAAEAGAVVTDSYGNSLDSTPLLDTSEANLKTILAASTPALHAALSAEINSGLARLAPVLNPAPNMV